MELPILFIGGHRKAGTTLCLNLLDGHPDLAVYPQDIGVLYAYFPTFLAASVTDEQRRKRLDRVVCDDLSQRLGEAAESRGFDLSRFRQRFLGGLADAELGDMRVVIGSQLQAFQCARAGQAGSNPRWYVAKETSIEIYASDLFTWFPGSRFLHVLRDPRDNYAALKAGVATYYSRFGEDEKITLFSLLHRGLLGFKAAMVNRERFGDQRYTLLRFEDLVSDPETAARALCDGLGIGFDDNLLTPTVLGYPTRGNSFDGTEFSTVSQRHVGSWHERITPEEAKIVEFHFREVMERFGYEPAFAPGDAMAAAAEFYKWANYKYFYFDRFAA